MHCAFEFPRGQRWYMPLIASLILGAAIWPKMANGCGSNTGEKARDRSQAPYAQTEVVFSWPAHGSELFSCWQKDETAITLALPEGTPIRAAADGVVVYVGNALKSYGNLVLIKHDQMFVSAYAHAKEILVKRDEMVKRGQIIGMVGRADDPGGSRLRFEMLKRGKIVDPRPYLRGAVSAVSF